MDPAEPLPDDIDKVEWLIAMQPKGIISEKTINGKVRYYHQWYEDGRQRTKYVKAEDVQGLRESIDYRRRLQEHLDELKASGVQRAPFELDVITGSELRCLCDEVRGMHRRDPYARLDRYLRSESRKVCILYGLRRTGKTTMMLQAIDAMSDEELERTAYVSVRDGDEFRQLSRDMTKMRRMGIRTVFVDEVTWLRDFIGSSSFFTNVMAHCGVRTVLSGTDSLGFWFAESDVIYGKALLIHTTYIPFREHSRLLGIDDVDDYIRYGGVLRQGEFDLEDPGDFPDDLVFEDSISASRYVDAAIALNIQNSLREYDRGGRFLSLNQLYREGKLIQAINNVVDDINHEFVSDVLSDEFASTLPEETVRNTYDTETGEQPLDPVDFHEVNERLSRALHITRNGRLDLTDGNVQQIRTYLEALEVFTGLPAVSFIEGVDLSSRTICTQPGMRFCQAQELIRALYGDRDYRSIPAERRRAVEGTVERAVMGHILEEVVIHDTMTSLGKEWMVAKLFFPSGEIDMMVWNRRALRCVLFEVKHSDRRARPQPRHILDEGKCAMVEEAYGDIVGRYVLHRGPDADGRKGVGYLNVADFLRNLPGSVTGLFEKE